MLDSGKPYSAQARILSISPEVRESAARHQESKPVACNCEHAYHFPPPCECGDKYCDFLPPVGHPYMGAPAGTQTILMVGAVCDDCAANHQW